MDALRGELVLVLEREVGDYEWYPKEHVRVLRETETCVRIRRAWRLWPDWYPKNGPFFRVEKVEA